MSKETRFPFGRSGNAQSDALSQQLLQTGVFADSPVQMAKDSHGTNLLHSHALSRQSTIRYGRIQYSLPYTNWYRVALENPGGVIACAKLSSDTGLGSIGPRETSLLPPDTEVFVLLPPTSAYGFILGVVPSQIDNGNFTHSDWLVQGGGVGLHKDAHHHQMLSLLADEGGVRDFSNGRPTDQLSYDWGRMAETGVGIHIDPAMFFLRVDELCGIYGYQQDQMLRIAGYNLDEWSAVHSTEIRDDEGEATYFRGETPYPWEMMGAFAHNATVHTETDDADVIHNEPKAKFEPIDPAQAPFFRYREFGGYLGQGRLREIVLPPKTHEGVNYTTDEQSDIPRAAFRESVSLDGTYALQSAKAVVLAKSGLIPAPKQVRPVEEYSEEADSAENDNYRFAGQHGEADEHEIGDLTSESENATLLTVSAVMDMHAYTFNWKSMHAFHYHQGDYVIQDYSEDTTTGATYLPQFSDLRYDMWLDRPSPEAAYVDHRYQDVNYYPVHSSVTLAEDGAVVIKGGQGEEIRMVGGSIQISCPGNIMLQPGKSVIAMGGDDIVMKARNSVDITSSDKDVRIKAENNLQMLAANSGDGSLLIESRATADRQHFPPEGGEQIRGAGIILKAAKGQVATMSRELYMRTGSSDGGITPGQICLDADKGDGFLRVVADSVTRYIYTDSTDVYGANNGDRPRQVNRFAQNDAIIGSRLRVIGDLQGTGGAVFSNRVSCVNSHFASQQGGDVDRIFDRQRLRKLLTQIEEDHNSHIDIYRKHWEEFINDALYAPGKTGHEDIQKAVSFSFRNKEQYATTTFKLPQVHWQLMDEVVGAGVAWKEKDVEYGEHGARQPWPGKDNWESDTFLKLSPDSLKVFDLNNNQPKDRSDEGYTLREYEDFTEAKPSDEYKVIDVKD